MPFDPCLYHTCTVTTLRKQRVELLVICVLTATLLFWNLQRKYLWQDEAHTAVLAMRLLHFGRPVAYDGVNLVSHEISSAEDTASLDRSSANPDAALKYFIERGDFKNDLSWTWHPWGQFVAAAISLKLLGPTTWAARLPFVLAGLLTVPLLYALGSKYANSRSIAALSCLLLTFNSYWILHSRQCRYYSLSGLFLLLTVLAYFRWQKGYRWGSITFVIAALLWFHVDYGTVWPVLAVLFMDSLVENWRHPMRTILVGLVLAGAMVPSIYFYQLWHVVSGVHVLTWNERFRLNLFNLNEYILPFPIVLAAVVLTAAKRKTIAAFESRLIRISFGIMVALALWVPTATLAPFLRYVIMAAPIGVLVTAWVLVRGCQGMPRWVTYAAASVLIIMPLASLPLHYVIRPPGWYSGSRLVRPELKRLRSEVFGHLQDPNRAVIEWLRQHSQPKDEILVNYEDLPLMFYLPNPIRGGIGAFRIEDDRRVKPQFIVLRRSVSFVYWPAFNRELDKYRWQYIPNDIPDFIWGNNPDPTGQNDPPNVQSTVEPVVIARRME
jgi:hypothetical protein